MFLIISHVSDILPYLIFCGVRWLECWTSSQLNTEAHRTWIDIQTRTHDFKSRTPQIFCSSETGWHVGALSDGSRADGRLSPTLAAKGYDISTPKPKAALMDGTKGMVMKTRKLITQGKYGCQLQVPAGVSNPGLQWQKGWEQWVWFFLSVRHLGLIPAEKNSYTLIMLSLGNS